MQTQIIEAPDDSSSSNVEATIDPKVADTPEAQKAEESSDVDSQETQTQADTEIVEFRGQKIPASKLDQLLSDYENDAKWKARNQAEAEATKREREKIAQERQELAELHFLKSKIAERPDVVQALLTPQKQRDFQAELRDLYGKKPSPLDEAQYAQWEMAKDQLIFEQAQTAASMKSSQEMSRISAVEHANTLERNGFKEFVGGGKVSQDEFKAMTQFITQNIRPVNDRYPDNSFEIAYKILHEDKWLESIKQETAKKSIAPLLKATVKNADAGKAKPQVQVTEEDDLNSEFVSRTRATQKGKWIPLPQ